MDIKIKSFHLMILKNVVHRNIFSKFMYKETETIFYFTANGQLLNNTIHIILNHRLPFLYFKIVLIKILKGMAILSIQSLLLLIIIVYRLLLLQFIIIIHYINQHEFLFLLIKIQSSNFLSQKMKPNRFLDNK